VHWTVGLILGLAVAVLVVLAGLWVSRTATLTRRVGSFGCLLAERESGPWRAGIAQYGRVRMYWWRRASLLPRAAAVWRRQGIVVVERHTVPAAPAPGQRALAVVVHCRLVGEQDGGRPRELWLKMAPAAYAGFTGWIEATPTAVRAVF
jgi:hypothetical protein